MNIAGIVCEFNPLHKGHAEHMRETRRLLGPDTALVCVMSGDFVQRGTPAVFDKHLRAKAAVLCGADLVLELPLPWCVASAERFALGAVSLLDRLGIVTHLSFGSECGDLAALSALALAASEEETTERIIAEMKYGLAYAPARQKVLEQRLGTDIGSLLEKPNNILGVEYIKALLCLNSDIRPMTTRRGETVHDGKSVGEYRSASEIRSMLEAGEDATPYLPAEAVAVFSDGRPVYWENLEQAYMARLRRLSPEDFELLPDAAEGLGRRVYEAVRQEPSVEAILSAVKTKRYALSRLRRILTCAVLDIRAEMLTESPPYARVLALNETGRILLRSAESSRIPVVTKPASVRALGEREQNIFKLNAEARDFYVLGCDRRTDRGGGSDWRTGPFVL